MENLVSRWLVLFAAIGGDYLRRDQQLKTTPDDPAIADSPPELFAQLHAEAATT